MCVHVVVADYNNYISPVNLFLQHSHLNWLETLQINQPHFLMQNFKSITGNRFC